MQVQRTQAIGNQNMGRQNLTFGQIRGNSVTEGVAQPIVRYLKGLHFPVTIQKRGDAVSIERGLGDKVTLTGEQLTNPTLGVQALKRKFGAATA